VVALGVVSAMPTRPYSAAIIGGLWPNTSPDTWSNVADGLKQKASELSNDADTIRGVADQLLTENSGETIEAMHVMYVHDSCEVQDRADRYTSMARAVDECAQLIYHTRQRLDEIDRAANEEIEQLKQKAAGLGDKMNRAMLLAEIQIIIADAHTRAEVLSANVAAAIAGQAALVGGSNAFKAAGGEGTPAPAPAASIGRPGDRLMDINQVPHGGGKGPAGLVQGAGFRGAPLAPPLQPGVRPRPADILEDRGQTAVTSSTGGSPGGPDEQSEAGRGATGPRPSDSLADWKPGSPEQTSAQTPPAAAPNVMPPMGPAPSPPAMPMGGGTFRMPPPTGMPSSFGGVPSPPVSPNLSTPPVTPPVSPSEFTRGFNAGLGSGGGAPAPAGPLLPPPAPPPPPVTPASATDLASAPVWAAPPPAAPVAGGGGGGGTPSIPPMMPAAAPGALPPFNSDVVPRQAAPVTPASGPPLPSAPPPAPPAAPLPPVAPLPPGVVASGVGATAAGAAAGVKSSSTDPLLESAVQTVYQLLHASRMYACIDWCVGVFKTPVGVDTVIVSNEGAGYIPAGVFVPRNARMLFADLGLANAFQARWFGWVNPAETMVAYSSLRCELDPNIELFALAVSNDNGGSALPAQRAAVPHYEDCSLMTSPIPDNAPPPRLDESRMHRLETVDRSDYNRLTNPNTPVAQHLPYAGQATDTTVRAALARASGLLGLSVPAVIRHVLSALTDGEEVTEEQWTELEMVKLTLCLDSAAQRPGRLGDSDGPSDYARAYHNLARAAEALSMWRGDEPACAEIAYLGWHIKREGLLWSVGSA
jgi:hypothetical protein